MPIISTNKIVCPHCEAVIKSKDYEFTCIRGALNYVPNLFLKCEKCGGIYAADIEIAYTVKTFHPEECAK